MNPYPKTKDAKIIQNYIMDFKNNYLNILQIFISFAAASLIVLYEIYYTIFM